MLSIRSGSIVPLLAHQNVTTKRAVTGEPDPFLVGCNVEDVVLYNKWKAIATVPIIRS